MKTKKTFLFGVIGCGNIGNVILKGLIQFSGISSSKICASDIDKDKTRILKKKFRINIVSIENLVKNSKIIIIAVKPKDIPGLCSEISSYCKNSSIVISVAAGIEIEKIKKLLNKNVPIIRMMPNLAIGYGKGLIAYCWKNVPLKRLKYVIKIFSKMAFCFPVKERDMAFITAVSGSGPGFLFYLGEIIYELLKKKGFSNIACQKIVSSLFEGSGKMMSETGEKPALLKEKVCSPGGTTIAGISKLKQENFEQIINDAFQTAEKRAIELAG